MKRVLLLGEYSGVHTNLANALKENGYDVRVVHGGDGFKGFKPDVILRYERFKSENRYLDFIFRVYTLVLTFLGIAGLVQITKYIKEIRTWKNFDVVQLINPLFLSGFGSFVHFWVFRYLRKNNKKLYLCALGDDYFYVKYCLEKHPRYSMFENLNVKNLMFFSHSQQYIYAFGMAYLNKYIVRYVNSVIPGLYDYYQAYRHYGIECEEIVPIIIEQDANVTPISNLDFPLKIFHGKQNKRAYHKGDAFFEKAIENLKEKYPNDIEYVSVSNIPYQAYLKLFADCHIFIDQCYSYDCGVNALLGMSKGKVVFSGFEREVKEYYSLDNDPLINALPSSNEIFKELERLILNSKTLKMYSINALNFIKDFHSKQYVISKYENIWFSQK